jgi:hypothetical protein
MNHDQRERRQTDTEFVLRLAALPRPAGEKHEIDPPHHLCLGDDPCICIHLVACEQRVLREAIAAIEAEQREIPTDTWRRIGLGSAKSAVTKLMREKE